MILKSTVLNEFGKRKEALLLAEEVLKESEKSDNTLLHVDVLLRKIVIIFYMPDFHQKVLDL
jgi:hypothetical protein